MRLILSLIVSTILSITNVHANSQDVNVDWNESYFETKPWINEFKYVLVVNKANKGADKQTLRIYEYGQLITKTKVSTGRETFESAGTNKATRDSYTGTPTGFYTPTWLSKDHKSSLYVTKKEGKKKYFWSKKPTIVVEGASMPFAIFFNGGIAFHAATGNGVNNLGNRASGGCIRLLPSLAKELFDRVQETSRSRIPKFTKTGQIVLDKNGDYVYNEKLGYSVLVIVVDKTI